MLHALVGFFGAAIVLLVLLDVYLTVFYARRGIGSLRHADSLAARSAAK